ncbi:hypothetical protein TSUD_29540 [Trifolium subterraneum]|uniref:Uncharacterized protein n=1 Tax=Trifolium subterraneum TaxID=3900 RepID=A0A2Z6NDI2_TRISU|nr:hypothetical protein TSUD_29540 [Trifolium subterraneum]
MELRWDWGNPNFMGLGSGMAKSAPAPPRPAPLPCLVWLTTKELILCDKHQSMQDANLDYIKKKRRF